MNTTAVLPTEPVSAAVNRVEEKSTLIQRSEALVSVGYVTLGILVAIVVVCFPAWLVSALLLNWL